MEELFGNMYCWLESLFGQYLAEYLWGYNCETQSYDLPNVFNYMGIITIIVALVVALIYYYVIKNPHFVGWLSWLFTLIGVGIIGMIIGTQKTLVAFHDGQIGDCLMNVRDEEGNVVSQLIHASDCWMFGVTNLIFAMIFFIIFSFIFKWGSRTAKYVPF